MLIVGCTANLDDYEPQTNNFDIKEYFNGDITAWGVIQDSRDKVTRRFCVEIEATWQEVDGVLAETFYFDDGEVSYRNWHFKQLSDGSYQGTAEDVIGVGSAEHKGFALQLQYTLLLAAYDAEFAVSMDDWMFQIDEHRVMNKTAISKFGVN